MQLVRYNPDSAEWNPFALARRLQDSFDQSLQRAFWENGDTERFSINPQIDIQEDVNTITIEAELPGLTQDDFNIEVNNGRLTLKGEKTENKEVKQENYTHRERRYGAFQRVITLPETADAEKIEANYVNGVLKIAIPKKEEAKPRRITVQMS
ncbi:Hsp20/alpha crystallin family protein [Candidatus Sumerlaeota bacterium]|nr:Hsp20/alpha crystallin family protein [Candidatus Sumerlaeota bacterium]